MSVDLSSYDAIFFRENNNIWKEIPFMGYTHNLFTVDFNHYFIFSVIK